MAIGKGGIRGLLVGAEIAALFPKGVPLPLYLLRFIGLGNLFIHMSPSSRGSCRRSESEV